MHWAWVFAARKEEPGQLELRQVLSAHPPPRAVSEKELAQPDTWAQNGSVWGAEGGPRESSGSGIPLWPQQAAIFLRVSA